MHSHSAISNSLWSHGLYPARLLCPWGFPGKNTDMDFHFLVQRIFLTQGLNLHLLSSALAGRFLTISATWEAQKTMDIYSSTMSFIIFINIVVYPH